MTKEFFFDQINFFDQKIFLTKKFFLTKIVFDQKKIFDRKKILLPKKIFDRPRPARHTDRHRSNFFLFKVQNSKKKINNLCDWVTYSIQEQKYIYVKLLHFIYSFEINYNYIKL